MAKRTSHNRTSNVFAFKTPLTPLSSAASGAGRVPRLVSANAGSQQRCQPSWCHSCLACSAMLRLSQGHSRPHASPSCGSSAGKSKSFSRGPAGISTFFRSPALRFSPNINLLQLNARLSYTKGIKLPPLSAHRTSRPIARWVWSVRVQLRLQEHHNGHLRDPRVRRNKRAACGDQVHPQRPRLQCGVRGEVKSHPHQ